MDVNPLEACHCPDDGWSPSCPVHGTQDLPAGAEVPNHQFVRPPAGWAVTPQGEACAFGLCRMPREHPVHEWDAGSFHRYAPSATEGTCQCGDDADHAIHQRHVEPGWDPEAGYPPCPDHQESQHRDGKPPWCSACGWNRGRPAILPRHRDDMPGIGARRGA